MTPCIPGIGEVVWAGRNEFSLTLREQFLLEEEKGTANEIRRVCYDPMASGPLLRVTAKRFEELKKEELRRLTIEINFDSYNSGKNQQYLGKIVCALNKYVSKKSAEILCSGARSTSLSFFVGEDIRNPSRYLEAMARKMFKWATVPDVIKTGDCHKCGRHFKVLVAPNEELVAAPLHSYGDYGLMCSGSGCMLLRLY